MTSGRMFSFRVQDARIEQQLEAMQDRSAFIRRAVVERLSTRHEDVDDLRRLRAGLVSIADSSAAILDAGGGDVPELVRVGLIGIGSAATILAADDPGEDEAEPRSETGSVIAADAAETANSVSNIPTPSDPHIPKVDGDPSPSDEPELPLGAVDIASSPDREPNSRTAEPTKPNQEDQP